MEDPTCRHLPSLVSSFIDAFVDFSVSGGLFLPPPPKPPAPVLSNNADPRAPFPAPPLQTRYPLPERLLAIGDVHGDLEKLKQSLRLAGLIDASDRWSGDSATVVQIGDVLDRGGEELRSLYFLEKLKRQAAQSGGTIITMNGNHEIMNVEGDFRYVTPDALEEFNNWGFWYRIGNSMKTRCSGIDNSAKDPFEGVPLEFRGIRKEFHEGIRARIAALRPNGPISNRFLSNNVTVLVMGDNVFVHGGLLANHVEYGLEKINEEVRDWINGRRKGIAYEIGSGRNSIVWLRKYSETSPKKPDCSMLAHVLATIPGARRMIMGHTIQDGGINGACANQAIRIDVGMSRGCENGLPEVLEICRNSDLRVLTMNSGWRVLPSNPPLEEEERSVGAGSVKDGLGLLVPKEDRPGKVEVRA